MTSAGVAGALRRHLATIAVALPFVALSINALVGFRTPATAFGDTAVIGLRTLAASRGHELLGPYSRFGWQHPGPAFFYWAAPFFRLAGMRVGGLAVAAATINLVWAAAGTAAVRRAAGSSAAWITCAVVVFTAWRFGFGWFQNPWNPLLIVLPITAAGLLASAVVAGVRWALPALALTASFAAQNHVGTAPVLIAMLLVALPAAVWQHRRVWRQWWRTVAVTAGASVLAWLPPIGEELAHSPGNLSQLIDFFREHPGPGHPINEVLRLVGPQLTLTGSAMGTHITGPSSLLAPMSTGGKLLLLLLGGTLVAGIVGSVRAKQPFLWTLNAVALASALAALISTRGAYGDLEAYFTSFSTGIGMLVWIAVLLNIATLIASLGSERRADVATRAKSATTVAVLCLSLAVIVPAARRAPIARHADRPSVKLMADWATAAMRGHQHQRVLVRFVGPDPWVDGAGLMLELERQGIRVSVRPELYYLFGPTYRSRGNEQMTVIVTHSSLENPQEPRAENARYLGTNVDGMAVWVAEGRVYGPTDRLDDGSAR